MIHYLYEKGQEALKQHVPVSLVIHGPSYESVRGMKYTISNEDLQKVGTLMQEIDRYYEEVTKNTGSKIYEKRVFKN